MSTHPQPPNSCGTDAEDAEFERAILEFYDQVAPEYDDERDLWSDHYNNSTQAFLRHVLVKRKPKRVLDVGAGSGNHALLYAAHGAETFGVDPVRRMLFVASYKSTHFNVETHFVQADAQRLPFSDVAFDFVACTGSVLNYCPSPECAIAEFSRVLKPGGTMVVGFDNPVSLDYLWIVLDATSKGRLGYEIPIKRAIRLWNKKAPFVFYPYFKARGDLRHAPERPLRFDRVAAALTAHGIQTNHVYGVHILSSLLPFTVTSNPKARPWLASIARRLCSLDGFMRRLGGVNKFAYHVLILGTKS